MHHAQELLMQRATGNAAMELGVREKNVIRMAAEKLKNENLFLAELSQTQKSRIGESFLEARLMECERALHSKVIWPSLLDVQRH